MSDILKQIEKEAEAYCLENKSNAEGVYSYSLSAVKEAYIAAAIRHSTKPALAGGDIISLMNKIAMQIRFHTVSNKTFPDTIDDIQEIIEGYIKSLNPPPSNPTQHTNKQF
jgi:hypothetical protein